MTETEPQSLLDELDRQQDEVLKQLDELNARIEALLNVHGSRGPTAADVPPADAPARAADGSTMPESNGSPEGAVADRPDSSDLAGDRLSAERREAA